MKTFIPFVFLFIIGMILLPGCSKESKLNVPVSFTDKEGNIFIQIDTISNSFYAYSVTKINQGRLTGVFSDTIRSAFYLAILTDPRWDTAYHASDTLVFPTHYTGHNLTIKTELDLTHFTSPYHFLLLGLPQSELKSGAHGYPSVLLTVDTEN